MAKLETSIAVSEMYEDESDRLPICSSDGFSRVLKLIEKLRQSS
jgi:hypothetical protein